MPGQSKGVLPMLERVPVEEQGLKKVGAAGERCPEVVARMAAVEEEC
jgi:hypothetical protein